MASLKKERLRHEFARNGRGLSPRPCSAQSMERITHACELSYIVPLPPEEPKTLKNKHNKKMERKVYYLHSCSVRCMVYETVYE